MVKKARETKRQQLLQSRTFLQWVAIILLLIIIWLLLAIGFKSWPFNASGVELGSAFSAESRLTDAELMAANDAKNKANESKSDKEKSDSDSKNDGSVSGSESDGNASNGGGSGSGSTGGGSNGSGSNGGGSGSGSTGSSSPILTFAAGVDRGDTKESLNLAARGLNRGCTVVVKTSTVGKQEVCTYTEGKKVVTVTLLNDRVVSASRSGF